MAPSKPTGGRVHFAPSVPGAVALDWRHFERRRSPCLREGEVRFFQLIAVSWLALVCAFSPADAETRDALVIGNGAYQNLPRLKNPPNDARDLADALKKLDFDVDLGVDLALSDMQRKVTTFARRAETANVALAFFAGHGVQAPDQRGSAMNYLLPIDATLRMRPISVS
jgi:hypothetical protein